MKSYKKFKILILLLCFISQVFADEFIVKSLIHIPNAMEARREPEYDINGDACALIKIKTDIDKEIYFDSNVGLPLGAKRKNAGEWNIYVVSGEQALKLKAKGFIPKTVLLQGAGEIKGKNVYELVLTSRDMQNRQVGNSLFSLTFNLNVEDVYIRKGNTAKILSTGRVAGYELEKGEYKYYFEKKGYKTKEELITVKGNMQLDIKMEKGRSSFTEGVPGIVFISSQPSGAEIYLNDKYLGVTPYQTELQVGDYDLKLLKDLYYPNLKRFTVVPGKTKVVPEVQLKANYAYLSVSTRQTGTDIYLNDKYIGKAPIEKRVISSGNYNLKIQKKYYLDYSEEIQIEDGMDIKRKNLTLKKNFGSLDIDCNNVDSVAIYLNGNLLGKTPLHLDSVICSSTKIEAKKQLYRDYSCDYVIYTGENKHDFVMMQNYGILDITAPNCKVSINNRFFDSNIFKHAVLPGHYIVKGMHEDGIHYPDSESVYIGIGEVKHINLEPEYILGSVSVLTDPPETAGSEIYINGELQSEKSPAIFQLPIGIYNIQVKHSNYLDQNHENIEIRENNYHKEQFQMLTYRGSMKQKENKWKTQKWIALGSSFMICGVGGGGGNYMGWEMYSRYAVSHSTAAAEDYRRQSELYFLGRDVSYGVSLTALGYSAYAWVQEMRFKHKQKKEILVSQHEKSISYDKHSKQKGQDKLEANSSFNSSDKASNRPIKANRKVTFIAYDTPPTPIGGMDAVSRNIIYPKNSNNSDMKGQVSVQVYVNYNGFAENFKILKGMSEIGFNQSAINAIKKTKFKPATRNGKVLGVWITIPVFFK